MASPALCATIVVLQRRKPIDLEMPKMERRFTALRVFGTLLKVCAWITLILGLLSAVLVLVLGFSVGSGLGLFALEQESGLVGILSFLIILILAVVLFLFLYAVGEVLFALISIEENTRRSAYILQKQLAGERPTVPADQQEYEEEDQR